MPGRAPFANVTRYRSFGLESEWKSGSHVKLCSSLEDTTLGTKSLIEAIGEADLPYHLDR